MRLLNRICAAFCVLILLSGCNLVKEKEIQKASEKKRFEADFLYLFDTATKLVGYTDTKEEFEEFSNIVYDELKVLHELFDIYNDYEINNIKTINDNAGKAPVKVDKKIIDLILACQDMYELTNGKVNVAMGSVLRVWHNYREQGSDNEEYARVPSMDELVEASKHTAIEDVIIDENASTVFIKDEKLSLDVGAIAKGYAAQLAADAAVKAGHKNGLISVGGNVVSLGNKPEDKKWNVGIQDPHSKNETLIKIIYISNQSLVTSGDYQRYYIVDGKVYHHLIDPETLFPGEYFSAVSIITSNSGIADALSTAVFLSPFEDGIKLVESLPDTYACWVFKDGSIKYSKGFEQLQ